MDNKYIHSTEFIHRTIVDYVECGVPPEMIASIMDGEYKLEIEYFYVPKDRLHHYYKGLADIAWYCRYGHHDHDNPKPYIKGEKDERTGSGSSDTETSTTRSSRGADNSPIDKSPSTSGESSSIDLSS